MFVILKTTGEYSIRETEAVAWSHSEKRAERAEQLAEKLNTRKDGHYSVSDELPHESDVVDGVLYIHKRAE